METRCSVEERIEERVITKKDKDMATVNGLIEAARHPFWNAVALLVISMEFDRIQNCMQQACELLGTLRQNIGEHDLVPR